MTPTSPRALMNHKPVHFVPAKTVLNLNSGFKEKLLCDGPTFSLGDLCGYTCSFCYVPALVAKMPRVTELGAAPESIVVRRENALEILRGQLLHPNGKRRFPSDADRRVVFASPLVDVAANVELADETVAACRLILEHTAWEIRLLSKSNLLPRIARALAPYRARMIYGVSTGTLEDAVAKAFEGGTALVSKRIASLRWLQDEGFRTFGMICPSLPRPDNDYRDFARECAEAIRAERCEHVWAEVINVRGESMTRTVSALSEAGFARDAAELERVSTNAEAWETYNRATFLGHADALRGHPGKLRFLTYVKKTTLPWWKAHACDGAVLLGAAAAKDGEA